MALTDADIETHKRLLRSYARMADQITKRMQDDEQRLIALKRAIRSGKSLLRSEGVDV